MSAGRDRHPPEALHPGVSLPRRRLLEAAALLERRGHCKHVLRDASGRHCVLGALMYPSGTALNGVGRDDYQTAIQLAGAELWRRLRAPGEPTRWTAAHDLVRWNNEPERTGDEVVALLRAAAETAP